MLYTKLRLHQRAARWSVGFEEEALDFEEDATPDCGGAVPWDCVAPEMSNLLLTLSPFLHSYLQICHSFIVTYKTHELELVFDNASVGKILRNLSMLVISRSKTRTKCHSCRSSPSLLICVAQALQIDNRRN